MRQSISLWLLIILFYVVPVNAPAQTRFFERGDSGFIPSLDLIGSESLGHVFDWEWGAHATYTIKGLIDLGAGFELDPVSEDTSLGPKYFLTNIVLIGPKHTKGYGLEFIGRYTYWDKLVTNVPFTVEERESSISTGLRGYFRNAPANLIVGLSGQYRFHKYETLVRSGEEMYGHDEGEAGFGLDGHFLAGRLVHFSLQAEYVQNKKYSFKEGWLFKVIVSAGIAFGLNPEPQASS